MRMGRPKVALILTTDERRRLESLAHRSRSASHVARRARILLGEIFWDHSGLFTGDAAVLNDSGSLSPKSMSRQGVSAHSERWDWWLQHSSE